MCTCRGRRIEVSKSMKPNWPAKDRDKGIPELSSCIVTGIGVGRWEKGLLMVAPEPCVMVVPLGRRMPAEGGDITVVSMDEWGGRGVRGWSGMDSHIGETGPGIWYSRCLYVKRMCWIVDDTTSSDFVATKYNTTLRERRIQDVSNFPRS